nr:MAG TPA: hypothetical protein [Caudoviricetes sp.]
MEAPPPQLATVRVLTTEISPKTVTLYAGNPNRKDVGRRPASALTVVLMQSGPVVEAHHQKLPSGCDDILRMQ